MYHTATTWRLHDPASNAPLSMVDLRGVVLHRYCYDAEEDGYVLVRSDLQVTDLQRA